MLPFFISLPKAQLLSALMNGNCNKKYLSLYNRVNFIDEINKRTEESFNVLFYIYNKVLIRFANRYVDSMLDAEDIVSDVFLHFWRTHNKFENRENLRAFLYAITRNKAINLAKRKRRLLFNLSHLDQRDGSYYSIENYNNSTSLSKEFKSFFNIALGELPKECKKIFSLLYKGLPSVEIAKKLNLAPSTVRAQKRRGIDLIRDQYLLKQEKEKQITKHQIECSLEITT